MSRIHYEAFSGKRMPLIHSISHYNPKDRMIPVQGDLRDSEAGGRKRDQQSQGRCLDAERSRVRLPFVKIMLISLYISMKLTWENGPPGCLSVGRWCLRKCLVVQEFDCSVTRGFCAMQNQLVEQDIYI